MGTHIAWPLGTTEPPVPALDNVLGALPRSTVRLATKFVKEE